MQGKTCYVAAGSAGKGQETYIKIWKAKIGKVCPSSHSLRRCNVTSVHEKDTVDIGDTVVDIVQAVTVLSGLYVADCTTTNRRAQRRPFNLIGDRLVRSAIPWAVALLVFLCSFWIGCRVPWERVWDTACYVVRLAISTANRVTKPS